MEKIKEIILGLLFLVAFAAFVWWSDWAPLNLIFGPQYNVEQSNVGKPRDRFVADVVPRQYPKLMACLKGGSEVVRWVAQSGETQWQRLEILNNGSFRISTEVFVGSSPETAATAMQAVSISMLDFDRNGVLDEIVYVQPNGQRHRYTTPFDETSQFLWDSGLAVAFRKSKCFR